MAVLDRKLLRDLLRMWTQVLAIALVMACGVATIITSVGAYRSLDETRGAFYDRYRFASLFASVTRAPASLRESLARIDGVAAVELRIVKSVLLDVDGMAEPAAGVVISLPEGVEPSVNRLYLREGRWPVSARSEVAVLESFARAHSMLPGSRFSAILNGHKRILTVTAVVLSPEYIYAVGPGDIVPDQRRFGIIYVPRKALEGAFDMAGAFNDIVIRTHRQARLEAITDSVDELLRPFGGTGAIGRKDQTSHAFLDNELTQLRAMASVIPPIFLFVSAFLVNMILTRLISLEREQIGLMKAVGYGSSAVAWHYAKLTLVIAVIGVVIGAIVGNLLGRGMTRLYGDFFSFPFLVFRQSADLYLIAAGVSAVSALAGSARPIIDVLRLPPAVAMRPPAPTLYRSILGGRALAARMSQLTLMALRHLMRWPLRAATTALGISFAVALLVTALFSFDAIEFMVDTVFFRAERQDATLVFAGQRAPDALLAVSRLPGVMRTEGFRATQAVLSNAHRERRLAISTIPAGADLARVLDVDLNPLTPPKGGLMISERVAFHLDLHVGDLVDVRLLEYGGRSLAVPITAIVQSYVGLAVYMDPEALDRLIGDGPRLSGARVAFDPSRTDDLYSAIKSTPAIGGIALQAVSRDKFHETIGQNVAIMTTVYVVLAIVITFGVVYNSARIQHSERARELASLRVFGFTRGEVSSVLLTELAVVALLAQPLGWTLGAAFSWSVVRGFESDLFRIPFVIERSTFAIASLIVIAIAILSALIVRRRVDRLDLVRVLKTRD
jgi:putative ABC transport system permease protein